MSLSAIFHSWRPIISFFCFVFCYCFFVVVLFFGFLQLLSLSAAWKSAHHLWLVVEAEPSGVGIASSPTCFGFGALAEESPQVEVIPPVMAGTL